MESERQNVEPLSPKSRSVLIFFSRYAVVYMSLSMALHVGALLHTFRFEQMLAPLGFGLAPLLIVGWILGKGNTLPLLQYKLAMKGSPIWMKCLTAFFIGYLITLLVWHWFNRPEQFSTKMDLVTPIHAGQIFSLTTAAMSLQCLRLAVWRLNSQPPEDNAR